MGPPRRSTCKMPEQLGEQLTGGEAVDPIQIGSVLTHVGRAVVARSEQYAKRLADLEDRIEVLESTARGARKTRFAD